MFSAFFRRRLSDQLIEQESKLEFDPKWYLETYPDVAAAGVDPEDHYRNFGAKEGRLPGPQANE